jgi:hypothetical protein
MINKLLIGKDLDGNDRGLVLRYYPGMRQEGLKKTTETLSQDIWSANRDLNPVTQER